MGMFRIREGSTDEREGGGEPSVVRIVWLFSQAAPSGREEVLGKTSPRQNPHIAILPGTALDHNVHVGSSCVCVCVCV